ncbi:glycoside hydrolase superfamily [Cunninghamella echinulata]|nr:glycoside hydrolase superfamily [Cunninghamella echinulata]
MLLAFALQNKEGGESHFEDDWAVNNYFPKIIDAAHKVNTKVLLSVGGWLGSKKFSSMVASSQQRQKFIQWHIDFIQKYKTDGIDIGNSNEN